jgi:uracil-DNA glycosylase family 4
MTTLRGTTEGADCENCPYARGGVAAQPVLAMFPADPKWILIGEAPGYNEQRTGVPFNSSVGEVVGKALAMVRRGRDEVCLTKAVLCVAPNGTTEHQKNAAVRACAPRLRRELAMWPGKPVLTLGAVTARAVIPKAALDAVDPPESGKRKRGKPKNVADEQRKREAKLAKIEAKLLVEKMLYRERQIIRDLRDRGHKKIPKGFAKRQALVDQPAIERKAAADAVRELDIREAERAARPKTKAKRPIKISDIASTMFEVDVDGTGVRVVIPTIHPASLLSGGGATLAGTHTPDLAFLNLVADAAKVDALASGRDVRLKIDIDIEVVDADRANEIVVRILLEALETGRLAIDLETYVDEPERRSALQCFWAKIRALGLATGDRAVSVLWDLLTPATLTLFRVVLASHRVTLEFHNGLYDRTVLAARGFQLEGPWEDSLLAHHAAFPGMAHNLQAVTSQFFAISAWKSEFRNSEETPEGLAKYNALDVGSTAADVSALSIWVKKTKTEKAYDHDRAMSEIASRMHLDGVPISREVNQELLVRFSDGVRHAKRAVEAIAEDSETKESVWHFLAYEQAKKKRKADPDDYDQRYERRLEELRVLDQRGRWRWKINAGQHVAALLRAQQIELSQVTQSGATSTKKDVLEGLAHLPLVRDVLDFRSNDKLLSTFCLAPGTKVLTEDLHWVPIETLRINDALIGFDEHGSGKKRKYRRSRVQAISEGVLPCYRITTATGVVIASSDHLWLARNSRAGGAVRKWVKTKDLQSGNVIASIGTPWEEDRSWEGGFISGFLEGEGFIGRNLVCLTQNKGPALDHIVKLIENKGFALSIRAKTSRCSDAYFDGGFATAMRVMGQFRPPRLLAKARALWEDKSTGSPGNHPVEVLKVEYIGPHPVIAMRTSTNTFIAEGMLTHNCWHMFDRTVLDQTVAHGYADERDRVHPIWGVHKISGRWASWDPVFSNVPKNKLKKIDGKLIEIRPNLRRQVVAPEGRMLVGFDSKQLEARVIALLSGDPWLCAILSDLSKDLHNECALVVFGKIFAEAEKGYQKQLREVVKPLEYGMFYLGSADTLWKNLLKEGHNLRLVDVQEAMRKLMAAMPRVVAWQNAQIATASQPPYELRDPLLDRRRTFPLGQVDANEAINWGAQTFGASIVNTGLRKMVARVRDRGYRDAFPILHLHDSVPFECWEDDAEALAADMVDCFDMTVEHREVTMRFPVDQKIAKSWDLL